MPKPVPASRPYASPSRITAGAPVSAFDWTAAGSLANYMRGRGSVLVPRNFINQQIAAGPNTGTYRYRVKPTGIAKAHVWLVELKSTTAGIATACSVVINGGAATSVTLSGVTTSVLPMEFYEAIGTPSSTEVETNIAISSSATGAVTVIAIALAEVPVSEMNFATDGAVDLGRVAPLAPVDRLSLGIVGLAQTASEGLNQSRRNGHHYFAKATEGAALTTTSTTYAPIYTTACEPPQLGRYLYTGDTTRALTFKAYGSVTGGATLSVRLTMTSGATTTITTTSGAAGWFGASNTIAVDAEDLTVSDGRRSARWDLAVIEYKVSSAIQTGSLWCVSIWEDNAP